MMQAEKPKHFPPAPANRRATLPAIDARERAATDFYGRPFAGKACAGRAAKNKGAAKKAAK